MKTLTAAVTPAPNNDVLREEHRDALEAQARAYEILRAAEHDIRQIARTINPADDDAPTVDVVSRLEAQLALGAAKTKLQQAQLAAHRADGCEAAARDAVKAAEDAAVDAEVAAILGELIPILLNARPLADRLGKLKERDSRLDVHPWGELQSSGSRGGLFAVESTLDVQIRSAKQYGWLDAHASRSK